MVPGENCDRKLRYNYMMQNKYNDITTVTLREWIFCSTVILRTDRLICAQQDYTPCLQFIPYRIS